MRVRGIDYGLPSFHYEVQIDDGSWEDISRNEIDAAESNGIVIHWNPVL